MGVRGVIGVGEAWVKGVSPPRRRILRLIDFPAMVALKPLALFLLAAILEVFGCYVFWSWLRLERSPWLIVPGVLSLVFFALTLAHVDAPFAGRAYAAYGGIYIASALLWLLAVERVTPGPVGSPGSGPLRRGSARHPSWASLRISPSHPRSRASALFRRARRENRTMAV